MYVLAGKVRERVGKGRGVIVRAVLAENGSMESGGYLAEKYWEGKY